MAKTSRPCERCFVGSQVYEQHKATAWFAFYVALAVNMFYTSLPTVQTVSGAILTALGLVTLYCAVQSWKIELRKAGVEQVGG